MSENFCGSLYDIEKPTRLNWNNNMTTINSYQVAKHVVEFICLNDHSKQGKKCMLTLQQGPEGSDCEQCPSCSGCGIYYNGNVIVLTLDEISDIIATFNQDARGLHCRAHLIVQYTIALITMSFLAQKILDPASKPKVNITPLVVFTELKNFCGKCINISSTSSSCKLALLESDVGKDKPTLSINIRTDQYSISPNHVMILAVYYMLAAAAEVRNTGRIQHHSESDFTNMMACVKKYPKSSRSVRVESQTSTSPDQ